MLYWSFFFLWVLRALLRHKPQFNPQHSGILSCSEL